MTFCFPEDFTKSTPDANGDVPSHLLANARIRHTGRNKHYCIMGFTWLGATDEWGFVHQEVGAEEAPLITRPLRHLYGERAPGVKRFEFA